MGSLPTRLSPMLLECCVFAAVAVVMLLLLPLWAVAAFTLRPLIALAALGALATMGWCAIAPLARRRAPNGKPRCRV